MKVKNTSTKPLSIDLTGDRTVAVMRSEKVNPGQLTKQDVPVQLAVLKPAKRFLSANMIELVMSSAEQLLYKELLKATEQQTQDGPTFVQYLDRARKGLENTPKPERKANPKAVSAVKEEIVRDLGLVKPEGRKEYLQTLLDGDNAQARTIARDMLAEMKQTEIEAKENEKRTSEADLSKSYDKPATEAGVVKSKEIVKSKAPSKMNIQELTALAVSKGLSVKANMTKKDLLKLVK